MKKSVSTLLAFIGLFLACPEIVDAQVRIFKRTRIKIYPSRLSYYRPYRSRNHRLPASRRRDVSVWVEEDIQILEQRPLERVYVDDSFRSSGRRFDSYSEPSEEYYRRQNLGGNSGNSVDISRLEKSVSDIDRRVALLEQKVAVNSSAIEEIKCLRKDVLEMKSLLLEFKKERLR